jgi:hypothetical protein
VACCFTKKQGIKKDENFGFSKNVATSQLRASKSLDALLKTVVNKC